MASSVAAEAGQRIFTLAGLRAASCQTQGLLRLPLSLQAAISAFIGDIPTREMKQGVARLTANMRARKEAAMISINTHGVEGSEDAHAAVEEYMGRTTTHTRLSRDLFSPAQAPLQYEYEEKNTAAYVAARMPAVYGAVHRVLSEVSSRLPDFKPSRILDYGSGPGTVLWAMREVWPEGVEHANLVESSQAMATACRTLLQDEENLPLIKLHPSLTSFSRNLRKSTRQHDLVISSYALGELSTTAERVTTMRQLWALTSNLLVLIEPGTPQGSSLVREMRAHILQLEKKKLRRAMQSGEAISGQNDIEGRGAFVVAPCPHDGQCPMDKTDKWCHFIQRLERTSSQRITKRHSSLALRAYEDEKFSFVVLQRGTRPRPQYPLEGLKIEPAEELFDIEDDNESWEVDDDESASGEILDSSNEASQVQGEHEVDGLEDYEDYEDEEVEGENEVADVGSGWARIVRPPIRRGRRTILDLCVATEKDGTRGAITRIVCSRRGNAAPLHPQARKSRWGDLWPC